MGETVIREARDTDMPWILGTWVGSHKSRLPGRRRHELARFRAHVNAILASRPVLAVMSSGPMLDTLHAWACATPHEMLWYAYVPRELEGNGLARAVIAAAFGNFANAGGYADVIPCGYRWPYPSKRFIFTPARKVA